MKQYTTDDLAERFGKQVTHIRNINHLSVEQLCDRVNEKEPASEKLAPETLAGLESGTTDVSARMVFRILSACGFEMGLFRM